MIECVIIKSTRSQHEIRNTPQSALLQIDKLFAMLLQDLSFYFIILLPAETDSCELLASNITDQHPMVPNPSDFATS